MQAPELLPAHESIPTNRVLTSVIKGPHSHYHLDIPPPTATTSSSSSNRRHMYELAGFTPPGLEPSEAALYWIVSNRQGEA